MTIGVNRLTVLLRHLGIWEPSLRQPIGDTRYVVIDTELSGLDHKQDAIIALSAIRMRGARILLGETFYGLVNPERELARENVLVHRLSNGDLAFQPTIDVALEKFAEFIGEDVIVGHFIGIDLGFLKRDVQRHLNRRLKNSWLDTYRAHEWMRAQQRQFLGGYGMYGVEETDTNLFDLARRYQIPVKQAHHALHDAFTTAQLWQRLVVKLSDLGVRRLGDALAIAGG